MQDPMNNPSPKPDTDVVVIPQQVKVLDVEMLGKYRENAHVLVAQSKIVQLNPMFQVRLERVDISTNTDDKDIYQLPGTYFDPRFALSSKVLFKLAQAAGIQRVSTNIVSATSTYVVCQGRMKRRSASGEWEYIVATYELDIEIIEADLYKDYVSKMQKRAKGAPTSEEECRQKANDGAMKIRRHKLSRAETGAYARCIRAMLGIENGYRLEELSKPFLVPATSFSLDMADPEMKTAAVNAGKLLIAQLWGNSTDVQEVEATSGKTTIEIEAEAETYHATKFGTDEPPDDNEWGADDDGVIYDHPDAEESPAVRAVRESEIANKGSVD
jgi:hypothetical protein